MQAADWMLGLACSPITTEVLGVAGFDWILLDAEHAPNDVLSLEPVARQFQGARS
ncbi:MAG: hypothetical protein JO227_14075 [Acetobacteraceae bacterium]|nr:hypothetical protein [Acetobacteraceae bacterium]